MQIYVHKDVLEKHHATDFEATKTFKRLQNKLLNPYWTAEDLPVRTRQLMYGDLYEGDEQKDGTI